MYMYVCMYVCMYIYMYVSFLFFWWIRLSAIPSNLSNSGLVQVKRKSFEKVTNYCAKMWRLSNTFFSVFFCLNFHIVFSSCLLGVSFFLFLYSVDLSTSFCVSYVICVKFLYFVYFLSSRCFSCSFSVFCGFEYFPMCFLCYMCKIFILFLFLVF